MYDKIIGIDTNTNRAYIYIEEIDRCVYIEDIPKLTEEMLVRQVAAATKAMNEHGKAFDHAAEQVRNTTAILNSLRNGD